MPLFGPAILILELEPGMAPWPVGPPPTAEAAFTAGRDYLNDYLQKKRQDAMQKLQEKISEWISSRKGTKNRLKLKDEDYAANHLGVAVIDFNPPVNPVNPANSPKAVVYGWNMLGDPLDKGSGGDFPIGSLGKVAILYAAFQLRQDVREAIGNAISGHRQPQLNTTQLEQELVTVWKRKSSIWAHYIAKQQLPKLDMIFDLSRLTTTKPGEIDFKGVKKDAHGKSANIGLDRGERPVLIEYNADFDDSHTRDVQKANNVAALRNRVTLPEDFQGPKEQLIPALELLENMADGLEKKWDYLADLDFGSRLWMTTVWSDNCAATTCISDIGLGYIQSLMRASSLDQADGGLSLLATFESPLGAKAQARYRGDTLSPTNVEGQQLFLVRDSGKNKISVQSGRPLSFARLMMALQLRSLISEDASNEMIRLLRPIKALINKTSTSAFESPQRDYGIQSQIEETIGPFDDTWNKIGVLDEGPWLSEWLYVEKASRKFGLIVLGGRDDDAFSSIAVALKSVLDI